MVLWKTCTKKHLLISQRLNNLKMIFALLVTGVAFHMLITMIEIRVLGLEKPVRVISSYSMVLNLLNTSLYELSQQIVGGN